MTATICDACGSIIDDTDDVAFGDLVVHWRAVQCGEREVKLTPTERNLLVMLIRRRRLSHEAAAAALFPDCLNEIVRVYIKRLRRKLESIETTVRISCHYGFGYEITEGVTNGRLCPTH